MDATDHSNSQTDLQTIRLGSAIFPVLQGVTEDEFVLAVSVKLSQLAMRRVLTACTLSKHILVCVVATKPSLKSHQVLMRFALSVFGKTRCRIGLANTQLLMESD